MVKPRWITLIICIAIILMLGAAASGGDDRTGKDPIEPPGAGEQIDPEKELDKAKKKHVHRRGAVAPWPLDRCDTARTGCSKLRGPGASLKETASVDLYDGVLRYAYGVSADFFGRGGGRAEKLFQPDLEGGRGETFSNFRVGPGNRLYFKHHGLMNIFSYDMSSGQVWYLYYDPSLHYDVYLYCHSFDLDVGGCVIDVIRSYLRLTRADGTQEWETYEKGVSKLYITSVGKRIYVRSYDKTEEAFYYNAYNFVGEHLGAVGPFEIRPAKVSLNRVIEDPEGNIYFRDEHLAVYKVTPEGNIAWKYDSPAKQSGLSPGEELGPIYGHDDRIWVLPYAEWASDPIQPYCVFNSDGSIYKIGYYSEVYCEADFACLGNDNRLYRASEGTDIACYEDWDELVWTTEINGYLLDMVMDCDNLIYIVYRAWGIQTFGEAQYISVIDPADGSVMKTVLVDVPEDCSISHTELAIGENRKLFYLNTSGFLKEFSKVPVLKFKGGQ